MSVVVLELACARSGLELVDARDDGDGAGARGGSAPGAGDGGQSAGGSAGNAAEGGAPSAPMPNCTADSPIIVASKDIRWAYLPAQRSAYDLDERVVVELTPDSPRNIVSLGEDASFRAWSDDGRFLAYSGVYPRPIEILDFSKGPLPVDVEVSPHTSLPMLWSPSDGRFALVEGTSGAGSRLVIVDATTGSEQTIDLPITDVDPEAWSNDGRIIAVCGDDGLLLVNPSDTGGELVTVSSDRASEPLWSPDSRYVAFKSFPSPGSIRHSVFVFDMQSLTLEMLGESDPYQHPSYMWAGNSWLIVKDSGKSFFLDVSRRPIERILLADHADEDASSAISPEGKCYAYEGRCEATGEVGVCVKTLPPDPRRPSVLLQHSDGNAWFKRWAGTGDQLLLHSDREPWLVNVELDGGDFTRRVVTEGVNTDHVALVFGWNPNGRSNWIAYHASGSQEYRYDVRLWNRETGETFDVPTDGALQAWGWSRDGRYLFVEIQPSRGGEVYVVQEVLDGRLGGTWRLTELTPARSTTFQGAYLQP